MNFSSQYGEDKWISENLSLPDSGVFVEAGAGNGLDQSDTLYFEQLGWTGLLVEPDQRQNANLAANRPLSKVETCVLASEPGDVDFWMSMVPALSGTLRKEGKRITVPARRLDDVLTDHGIDHVDLMSIDTEGTELDVWKSFGSFPRPSIVIVEWHTLYMPDITANLLSTFEGDGYRVAHKTPGNLIFAMD